MQLIVCIVARPPEPTPMLRCALCCVIAMQIPNVARIDANDLDPAVCDSMRRNVAFNGGDAAARIHVLSNDARMVMMQAPMVRAWPLLYQVIVGRMGVVCDGVFWVNGMPGASRSTASPHIDGIWGRMVVKTMNE